MNVVDSSAWLEYFADGPHADFFAQPIEDTKRLVVPSICVAEVFKRVLQQRGEDAALQAVALMRQGTFLELNFSLAVAAATLGHELKLPLADSIVLATSHAEQAILWTQDSDFERLPGVKFAAKQK